MHESGNGPSTIQTSKETLKPRSIAYAARRRDRRTIAITPCPIPMSTGTPRYSACDSSLHGANVRRERSAWPALLRRRTADESTPVSLPIRAPTANPYARVAILYVRIVHLHTRFALVHVRKAISLGQIRIFHERIAISHMRNEFLHERSHRWNLWIGISHVRIRVLHGQIAAIALPPMHSAAVIPRSATGCTSREA